MSVQSKTVARRNVWRAMGGVFSTWLSLCIVFLLIMAASIPVATPSALLLSGAAVFELVRTVVKLRRQPGAVTLDGEWIRVNTGPTIQSWLVRSVNASLKTGWRAFSVLTLVTPDSAFEIDSRFDGFDEMTRALLPPAESGGRVARAK